MHQILKTSACNLIKITITNFTISSFSKWQALVFVKLYFPFEGKAILTQYLFFSKKFGILFQPNFIQQPSLICMTHWGSGWCRWSSWSSSSSTSPRRPHDPILSLQLKCYFRRGTWVLGQAVPTHSAQKATCSGLWIWPYALVVSISAFFLYSVQVSSQRSIFRGLEGRMNVEKYLERKRGQDRSRWEVFRGPANKISHHPLKG